MYNSPYAVNKYLRFGQHVILGPKSAEWVVVVVGGLCVMNREPGIVYSASQPVLCKGWSTMSLNKCSSALRGTNNTMTILHSVSTVKKEIYVLQTWLQMQC